VRLAAPHLAVVIAAGFAPAAQANRAYGRFDAPQENLLTFELADSGAQVRAATVRMWMGCDQDYGYQYVASFTVARRGRGDRLVERSPGRYRVRAVWPDGRDTVTFDGTLSITAVRARYARVHLVVRSARRSDRTDRCRGELSGTARREAGVLFAGATDDGEPVLLRRRGHWVDWVAGYGTACRPDNFMEGLHTDFLEMSGPATFGWPELIAGFSSGEDSQPFAQSVQLAGTIGPTIATGSFRITGSSRAAPPELCDTGERHWRAVAT